MAQPIVAQLRCLPALVISRLPPYLWMRIISKAIPLALMPVTMLLRLAPRTLMAGRAFWQHGGCWRLRVSRRQCRTLHHLARPIRIARGWLGGLCGFRLHRHEQLAEMDRRVEPHQSRLRPEAVGSDQHGFRHDGDLAKCQQPDLLSAAQHQLCNVTGIFLHPEQSHRSSRHNQFHRYHRHKRHYILLSCRGAMTWLCKKVKQLYLMH